MPIQKIEGLKGLKGLWGLSETERNNFLSEHSDKLSQYSNSAIKYNEAASILYDNIKFIDRFGEEEFHKLSYDERNTKYRDAIVNDAVQIYKDDSWFPQISNMTTEGKISLLESGFQTDEEFKQSVDKIAYDKNEDGTDSSFWTELGQAMAQPPGMRQTASDLNKEVSSKYAEGMTKARDSKFQAFIAQDNLKKIDNSKDLSDQYLRNLQDSIDSGKITYSDIEKDFDKYIGEYSNHYKAFKNSDELENFTVADKMRYLSDFMGVANKYGVESAVKSLNTKMQNYVSEHQSKGDWAINTVSSFGTKYLAEFMNTAVVVPVSLYKAAEDAITGSNAFDNYLQGKDKDGNELPAWYNPLYYQGMDQYNLLDPDAINEARQNGGISDMQNITRAGEEMEFISWKSLNDAFAQMGYMGSIITKNLLMGGAGNLISKISPAFAMSKIAQITGTTLEIGASVAGMAEMEGLSSFQETLQQANEIIDAKIEQDAKNYAIKQLETAEGKLKVQNEIEKLKKLYSNKELGDRIVDAASLADEATKNVVNNFYNEYKISNNSLYDEDRNKAIEAATSAYMTTASLFAAKEAVTNGMFQKFLFSKGTRKTLGDNGPKINYFSNPDGTVSAIMPSKWKLYGKPFIKQPLVEGLEEVSDTYVNNLGQGIGLNEYNSYHQKKYNPKSYEAVTGGLVGNLLNGINKANESMLTIDPWYEGFIGAISGISGGIIDSYHNKKTLKNLPKELEQINKIIKEKGSILGDVTAALTMVNESKEAVNKGDILSSIDAKQSKAFEVIKILDDLSKSEAGRQSSLYSNTLNTITELADGSISDEKLNTLVGQFLGQGSNKSVVENPDAKNIAVKTLRDNAKYLLDTQESLDELNYILDNYSNRDLLTNEIRTELAYLKVMGKNWQDRLNSIEESLGGRKGTFSTDAEYGSKRAYERKKKALEESLNNIENQLQGIRNIIKDNNFENSLEKKALQLREKSLKSILKRLQLEYNTLKKHSDLFENSDYSRTLSKEEILALPADQRAWMLNPKNAEDYSQEQQLVIDGLIKDLTVKDPSLLQQVQDAAVLADRILDANIAFSNIINNPVETVQYIKELEKQRNRKLINIYRQRAKEKVEELFENTSDEEAQTIARSLPYNAIKDYLDDHPDKKDLLEGISEVAHLVEDAYFISKKLFKEEDKEAKIAINQSIKNITNNSNNEEEAINAIEDAIDSDAVDIQTKSILDKILNELQELNYQRNSTKVANREAKKERQVAKEKAAEEAIKKQEEALKIAEEEAKTKVEVPKDGANLVSETMEDAGISPDGSNIQETIEVDETKKGSEEELTSIDGDVNLGDSDTSSNEGVEIYVTNEDPVANTTPTALIGNYFYRYQGKALKEDKYQEKREGSEEGDILNKFFNWIENAGIKLQEIIDNELASIMKTGAKVQFMMVVPKDNATHDDHMKDHIFEVVEYTEKVAKIHKADRGGVISANGKRWLIIGVAGPRAYNKEQGTYLRNLKEQIFKRRRYKHSQANPEERFYVDPEYYSQIESIGAGWLVRKLAEDTEVKFRGITELIEDTNRNPKGIPTLGDLKWLIQTDKGPKTVNVSSRNKVRVPKDILGNSGNVFVLVEAANGEYIPAAIKPVMYSEIKDGKLKSTIEELLIQLTSPDRVEREGAINKLMPLLHLKEKNILLSKDARNNISIVNGDITLKTFNLDDPLFNRMEFLESIKALNPRINITTTALSSPTTLEMLDEAGALTTDIALLGTTNADFNIYNVGDDGKPIINEPINNEAVFSSDLKKVESSVLILGQVYRKRKYGWVDAVDRVITDPRMLEQIRYNNIIQSSNLVPVANKDNQEYFIISQDMSNPVAVKRVIGTNTVTVASREQALALIEQMAKKAAEKKAAEALSKATLNESSLEDVSLGEEVMTQEDIYGQMFGEFVAEGSITLDENIPEEITPVVVEDINTTGTKSLAELQTGKELSTLGDILGNSEYGNRLDEILDRKAMSEEWVDIPDDISLLGSYLRKKGIATSGITDVDSWLNMIDECK